MRTLRFYDQVGLLSPSRRTEAGYRLYTDADLVRLQQILALKFLGFSLAEIKAARRASPADLRGTLAQQRAMLTERRAQIDTIVEAIDHAERVLRTDGCDWAALVNVIRAIQMGQQQEWVKKYFTDEQRETMRQLGQDAYTEGAAAKLAARGEWTEADQRRVDEQYAALYAGVRDAVAAGADLAGAEAQALAAQAIGLIEAFTGGDPEIEAGLNRWWANYAALPAERRPFQIPLTERESAFLNEAKAIYLQRRGNGGGD